MPRDSRAGRPRRGGRRCGKRCGMRRRVERRCGMRRSRRTSGWYEGPHRSGRPRAGNVTGCGRPLPHPPSRARPRRGRGSTARDSGVGGPGAEGRGVRHTGVGGPGVRDTRRWSPAVRRTGARDAVLIAILTAALSRTALSRTVAAHLCRAGPGRPRLSEQRDEFVGQPHVQRVLGAAGLGGGTGSGVGVGARIGGRHGDAPLSSFSCSWGSSSVGVEGVGDGDVDGLGVDRADEFVEAVQPGHEVGLAAQGRAVQQVRGQR